MISNDDDDDDDDDNKRFKFVFFIPNIKSASGPPLGFLQSEDTSAREFVIGRAGRTNQQRGARRHISNRLLTAAINN